MNDTELSKPKIDRKTDILIGISLLLYSLHDGWSCPKCGIIQGEPRKGWERYYCKHVGGKIDRQLMNYSKKITGEMIRFTFPEKIKERESNGVRT